MKVKEGFAPRQQSNIPPSFDLTYTMKEEI
jgi:hypothetical protein